MIHFTSGIFYITKNKENVIHVIEIFLNYNLLLKTTAADVHHDIL